MGADLHFLEVSCTAILYAPCNRKCGANIFEDEFTSLFQLAKEAIFSS